MRLGLLGITGITLMLVAVPSAAAPSRLSDTTVHLPSGALSQRSVLAVLLLLISQEEQQVHATLEALYGSEFVSTTGMEDRRDIERYLVEVMVERYKGTSSKAVFAAMVKFQDLIITAFREPHRTSVRNLRSRTTQLMSALPRSSVGQFENEARDWLTFLRDSLSRSGELSMIELQTLVSQRQQAIQLTTNLLAALADSARQVISNMGDDSAPADSTKTSKAGGAEQPSCPPCECSCP